ncbi:MAG: LysE family transporter [Selenomonadaceae bacterium]|nr:LysE family transporter [Selenomonadaceae bacterium]MBR1859203.1 LysE family transporter [Selenomonadaceae bacterium]
MEATIISSYLIYSLVTAYTPGPNNILSLHAVSQHGWHKGKFVLFGIAIGFLAVMLICAVSCYIMASFIPEILEVLKYVGAAYIAWLGVHIIRSTPSEDSEQSITFWNGFCLEFVNVKIILYAITIYTAYVIPKSFSLETLIFHALVITLIGISGTLTWAAMGHILQNFLNKHFKIFNLSMGLILIYCAVKLVID